MFTELLKMRDETYVAPVDFKLIRPHEQDNFNEVFSEIVKSPLPVVVPQDDDCDGFACATLFREFTKALNPSKEVDIYIPQNKSHGVDEAFVTYLKETYPNGCDIIITDSSTDCVDIICKLRKLGKVIHIDHHISNTEEELSIVCNYHANCRYERDNSFHHLSAGFYSYLHLACYCMEKDFLSSVFLEKQFTLATLSIISDICDLKVPFNQSIVKSFMQGTNYHPLLECFSDRFTKYNIYFLAFKVAPKINMLFRLRFTAYLKKLHEVDTLQPLIDAINGIYKNYKFVVEQSVNYLEIKDFQKFIAVDISYLNDLYPMFGGHVANFTGWYANKLSQKFLKPCLALCSVNETTYKGSVRDITEQGVYDILNPLPFIDGGGHPNAYGFSCATTDIDNLFSYFYYGLEDSLNVKIDTIGVGNLFEIDTLFKIGELKQFADYNDYTINDKIGLSYKIKHSDVVENFPNRSILKHSKLKIISFDPELKAGDVVKLVPDNQLNSVQLIANIVERN